MTIKEAEKLSIMKQVESKKLKQREASESLGLSLRQSQGLIRSYSEEGLEGLILKRRGKANTRKMPLERRLKIVATIRMKYPDFGPTFASEKLKRRRKYLVIKRDLEKVNDRGRNMESQKKERKKSLPEESKKKPRRRVCSSRWFLP